MKVINFRYLNVEEKSLTARLTKPTFAEIVVETGFLWRKKVETKKVCREVGSPFWYWVDTGKWCPDYLVEEAEKKHKAFIHLERINEKTN